MRSRTLPALACAAVLCLAACGSSGGSSSSAGNARAGSSPQATAKGGGGFCNSLTASLADTEALSTSALSGKPSDLKALVEKARSQAGHIVATAPDALRNDVAKLVNASTAYYDALAAANYDLRKIDAKKLTGLTSSDVQQASQRVAAYIQSHCGLDVGATP